MSTTPFLIPFLILAAVAVLVAVACFAANWRSLGHRVDAQLAPREPAGREVPTPGKVAP